jgi:tRNA (pseudouridine54-N1)-methyltransferase
MREFLLHSRTGYTSGNFSNLMQAGRLDITYQCILTSIFESASHRHDVVFHAVLNGPPTPPVHIQVNGNELRDARIDEKSWEHILKNVLNGKQHPGIYSDKTPFQKLVQQKHSDGYQIFVLNDRGRSIKEQEFTDKSLFVLGDHVGLPRKDENYALRFGTTLSLGREKYLAASCINIINYTLDQRN